MNTKLAIWIAVGIGGAILLVAGAIAAMQLVPADPSGGFSIDAYRYEQGQSSMLGLFQPSYQLIGGALQ